MCEYSKSDELLAWYDCHARDLPWRLRPVDRNGGVLNDPYHVWLSEIMLQQTTVATVKGYFEKFLNKWPTVHDLAASQEADIMAAWAGLGYYARARNLLKCAIVISREKKGEFPQKVGELIRLPGVGPYTAAAISSIAFDRRETVVDGNVIRVISRLFAVKTALPRSRPDIESLAASLTPDHRPGDYAQAIMDLGAVICTPRSPSCSDCPWQHDCQAFQGGSPSLYPVKAPRKPKPTRLGFAYLVKRADGAWLLERRPAKGLLGGTLGWPCSEWGVDPKEAPPFAGDWIAPNQTVEHAFTHFDLKLSLRVISVPMEFTGCNGMFFSPVPFPRDDLPTVMRKAYDAANAIALV